MSKAYEAADQAGASLHMMANLQAYQPDLLKVLDSREGVREHHQATDLALHATKQMACSITHLMSALVAMERLLWLNLSGI